MKVIINGSQANLTPTDIEKLNPTFSLLNGRKFHVQSQDKSISLNRLILAVKKAAVQPGQDGNEVRDFLRVFKTLENKGYADSNNQISKESCLTRMITKIKHHFSKTHRKHLLKQLDQISVKNKPTIIVQEPTKKQVNLTPVDMRSQAEDPQVVEKLQKQFKLAQDQAAKETDKAFHYLQAPVNFQGEAHKEKVGKYEVGVCHCIGRRPTMEDEHLSTSFNLNIKGKAHPVQLFGVFDGHGGRQAAAFVKKNLEQELHNTLNEFCVNGLTDKDIFNALKITFVRLDKKFKERSGTTATVAIILDGKLWTANVGDSRTILDNGIQLSEDAEPADPRYKKGIEKRGGRVFFNRINGQLGVARAIGDHNVTGVSPKPKITVLPLSMVPSQSHLILTCDGVYDVASTRQVAEAVKTHKNQSVTELAKNIVYSAYQAASEDNLSALVIKL